MKRIAAFMLIILCFSTLKIPIKGAVGIYTRSLPEYENPKDIIITQPPDGTVVSSSRVSILGACDREFPLYLNGKEISVTKRGFFSQYVTLAEGENIFTFKNNDKEKTIKIIKSDVSEITYQEPEYGIINRDYVTRRVRPDEDVNLLTPLARGTTFKIIGEAADYYKLEDGTYVYQVAIDILKSAPPANTIKSVNVNDEGGFTYIKYSMDVNALYDLSVSENKAKLVINASEDKSVLPDVKNTRISGISKAFDSKRAAYDIAFSNNLIGHFVVFNDGEMTVGFKFTSRTNDSLTGKTVILDAGHGGKDAGALGPLGDKGPVEKDYNLYVTLAVAEYLESKGANVLLTRRDDTFVELADRVSFILDKKPDISVSIHSNSRPITQDYGGASGALMYYTFDTGKGAAESILKHATKLLDMPYTPPFRENFALTRITNCPAVLFEMSFMSNPADYEWLFEAENLELIGRTLGEGVEDWLKRDK